MNGLTPTQAIETLWHMQIRLSRLVAIAFLWLAILSALLATVLGWLVYSHLSTLQQMIQQVPAWLAGLVTVGLVVSIASGGYRAYHWMAKHFLSRYLMKGV